MGGRSAGRGVSAARRAAGRALAASPPEVPEDLVATLGLPPAPAARRLAGAMQPLWA